MTPNKSFDTSRIPECVRELDARQGRISVLRLLVGVAIMALLAWSAAYSKQADGCSTDTECIQQCLRDLPINRPESECAL